MAITDWPAGERPREKLLQHGVSHLSDAELLAIFLRVGTRGQSAVDLARMLLNHFGSLNGIFQAELNEINALNGMGASKYCQLQAIFEMCRRALSEQMQHGDVLNSPVLVKEYLRLKLAGFKKEVFYALFLDTQNRVKASEILFEGTLTQASVYPREVIKRGLFHNAAAIIFAHNHPSGHAEPSEADKMITNELRTALRLIDITLHDHFIVAGNQIISFREAGLLR